MLVSVFVFQPSKRGSLAALKIDGGPEANRSLWNNRKRVNYIIHQSITVTLDMYTTPTPLPNGPRSLVDKYLCVCIILLRHQHLQCAVVSAPRLSEFMDKTCKSLMYSLLRAFVWTDRAELLLTSFLKTNCLTAQICFCTFSHFHIGLRTLNA